MGYPYTPQGSKTYFLTYFYNSYVLEFLDPWAFRMCSDGLLQNPVSSLGWAVQLEPRWPAQRHLAQMFRSGGSRGPLEQLDRLTEEHRKSKEIKGIQGRGEVRIKRKNNFGGCSGVDFGYPYTPQGVETLFFAYFF